MESNSCWVGIEDVVIHENDPREGIGHNRMEFLMNVYNSDCQPVLRD